MRTCPDCKNDTVIEDGYCGTCRQCTLAPEAARPNGAELGAAPGSARKPRVIPKWQVVEGTENMPGGCGPDFALIYLRGGRVLEVGDEGINVYRSFAHFVSGELSAQGLTFQCTAADSPSDASELLTPRQVRSEKEGA